VKKIHIFVLSGMMTLSLISTLGCKKKTQQPAIEQKPVTQQSTQPGVSQRKAGTVLETINSSGYTYLYVDTGTEKIWAAAPELQVKAGDSVIISDGMPMSNFHSKTLNRDFEMIYFVSSVLVNGSEQDFSAGKQMPANHPAINNNNNKSGQNPMMADKQSPMSMGKSQMSMGKSQMSMGKSQMSMGKSPMSMGKSPMSMGQSPMSMGKKEVVDIDISGIKKAAGGKTVAEIYNDKANLSDKEIVVRGKIVKFSPAIMGKNWIHLQDGSGSKGTNDLPVTTAAMAQVGDTVLVRGLVTIDKDFGAGYVYKVIIQDAEVLVE